MDLQGCFSENPASDIRFVVFKCGLAPCSVLASMLLIFFLIFLIRKGKEIRWNQFKTVRWMFHGILPIKTLTTFPFVWWDINELCLVMLEKDSSVKPSWTVLLIVWLNFSKHPLSKKMLLWRKSVSKAHSIFPFPQCVCVCVSVTFAVHSFMFVLRWQDSLHSG